MPREVTDADGVVWSCVQAYAGLAEGDEHHEAARVEDTDRFRVVCTPSGGAQTVQIELKEGWEEDCSDEELLRAIEEQRA